MRLRATPGSIVFATLWAALIAIFLWVGGARVLPNLVTHSMGPVDSLHSFDLYLFGGANDSNRAQNILQLFSSLPKNRRVVIFVRENDGSSGFLGLSMAYLAWPHRVQVVDCNDRTIGDRVAAIRPDSVAALVFCKMNQPRWLPEGIHFGKDVKLICLAQAPR